MANNKFIVFGGGGHVARSFAQQAISAGAEVTSVVRNDDHSKDLTALGAKPHLLSLESSSASDILSLIKSVSPRAVIFAAGAGGKGGPERTRAVDLEGLKKVVDAMLDPSSPCRRILEVSAVDVRDRSKGYPAHYTEESRSMSDRVWNAIGPYMHFKLQADTYLHDSGLDFTILRPGRLTHEPAGGCQLGITQLEATSRALVAEVLLACAEDDGTIGLTLDVMDGNKSVKEEVERCAKERIDAWVHVKA